MPVSNNWILFFYKKKNYIEIETFEFKNFTIFFNLCPRFLSIFLYFIKHIFYLNFKTVYTEMHLLWILYFEIFKFSFLCIKNYFFPLLFYDFYDILSRNVQTFVRCMWSNEIWVIAKVEQVHPDLRVCFWIEHCSVLHVVFIIKRFVRSSNLLCHRLNSRIVKGNRALA